MTAFLFDTHLLLWSAAGDPRLSRGAARLLTDGVSQRLFSPISLAEVAIKYAKRRADFSFPPGALHAGLLANGFHELPLTSRHSAALLDLPDLHGDPFDRLLVAQAIAEGLTLVTSDALLGRYSGRVMVV